MTPQNGPEPAPPTPSRHPGSGILWGWVCLAFGVAAILALTLYLLLFPEPRRRLAGAMVQWVGLLESGPGTNAITISCRIQVPEAHGHWKPWQGADLRLTFRPPDQIRLEGRGPGGANILWLREGNRLEVHNLTHGWGFRGRQEIPWPPSPPDTTVVVGLSPIRSPVPPGKVWMAVLTLQVDPIHEITNTPPDLLALRVRPQPRVVRAGALPDGEVRLWLRRLDGLPQRVEIIAPHESARALLQCSEWWIRSPAPQQEADLPAPPSQHVRDVPLRILAEHWNWWWETTPSGKPLSLEEHRRPPTAWPPAQTVRRTAEAPAEECVLALEGDTRQRARALARAGTAQVRSTFRALLYGWAIHQSLVTGHWWPGLVAGFEPGREDPQHSGAGAVVHELSLSTGLQEAEVYAAQLLANQLPVRPWISPVEHEGRQVWCVGIAFQDAGGFVPVDGLTWLVHRPEQGFAWASPALTGLWAGRLGINERQLAALWVTGPAPASQRAPMALPLGRLLESCATCDDAVDQLRTAAWARGSTFVLVDGRSGSAVLVDCPADRPGVEVRPLDASSDLSLAGSIVWQPLKNAGPSTPGPAGVEPLPTVEELLSNPHRPTPADDLTVLACLVPTTGDAWLVFYSSTPAGTQPRIHRLNLKARLSPEVHLRDTRAAPADNHPKYPES